MTTAKQNIFLRQWSNINKNRAHMEQLILKLMENPATDPEHMAQAHAMYSDVCKRMSEISHHVSNVIRTGATTAVEVEETKCLCGYVGKRIVGQAYRCPECGMN